MRLLLVFLVIPFVFSQRFKRGSYGRPPSAYVSPEQSSYSPPNYNPPISSYAPKPNYETNYGPTGYSQPQNYEYWNNNYQMGDYMRPWWARQRGPQIPWWKREQFMNQGTHTGQFGIYPQRQMYPTEQYINKPAPPMFNMPPPQNYPDSPPVVQHAPEIPSTQQYPDPPQTQAPILPPQETPVLPALKEKEYPEIPVQNGPPPSPPTDYPEIPLNAPPPRGFPAPPPPPPDPTPEYPAINSLPPLQNGFTLPPQAQVPDIPNPPSK